MDEKPLSASLHKIDRLIKIYIGIRYLVLLFLIDIMPFMIALNISKLKKVVLQLKHNFAKIKNNLYNFLPIKKILTFHNVIIPIKSAINKVKINTTTIYF